jgi:hypothetical protein
MSKYEEAARSFANQVYDALRELDLVTGWVSHWNDGAPRLRRRVRRKNAFVRWSKKERMFIRNHASRWSRQSIAKHLCRSPAAVSTQASQMSISLRK